MSDFIAYPSQKPASKGLHHTDYSDINEAMCFLGIISSEAAHKACMVGGDTWTPQQAAQTIEDETAALQALLDPADLDAIRLLQAKLMKSQALPNTYLAAHIKAIQGYNMSLFLVKIFGDKIKEVYFTNTRARLVGALQMAGAGAMVAVIQHATLSHPADLLLILEENGKRRPYGVSCKASFKATTPTVCNLGLGSVNRMILGNKSGCLPITTANILRAMDAAIGTGNTDPIIKVLRDKQVKLARNLDKYFKKTSAAPRALLTNFLHIQPTNLPYCIVSAEGGAIHGIAFELLQQQLVSYPGDFTGSAAKPPPGVITSTIDLLSPSNTKFTFKTRLKKAGTAGTTLKFNITLSLQLKRFLIKNYPLLPRSGGARLRSGYDTHMSRKIRQIAQIRLVDLPSKMWAALAATEQAGEGTWLAPDSTVEPIDGPYPSECVRGGSAAKRGGGKYHRKTQKRRRKTHRRRKIRKRTRRRRR